MISFEKIRATKWAILPEAFEALLLGASFGEAEKKADIPFSIPGFVHVENSYRAMKKGSVGIVSIMGELVTKEWDSWFGSVSYEKLSADLKMLDMDPTVKNIVLVFDSPGGNVSGVSDAEASIKNLKKPAIAYVLGSAASAAYWLASSADKVFASETSEVGSIGCVCSVFDYSGLLEQNGIKKYDIVSSVSPDKRPDFSTKKGRDVVQNEVDSIGNIFVEKIAGNRSTTVEDVKQNFGGGRMFVASEAKEKGMIDGVTTLDALLLSLQTNETLEEEIYMDQNKNTTSAPKTELTAEGLKSSAPSVYGEIFQMGAKAERERIQGIESISHPDAQGLIAKAKFDPAATKESVAVAFAELMSGKVSAQNATAKEMQDSARTLAQTVAPINSSSAAMTDAEKEKALDATMAKAMDEESKKRSK
ncbi:MAG: S49 family peptidase [Synergistaceae bacterium]|jgi:signal peptide peptidase SppA